MHTDTNSTLSELHAASIKAECEEKIKNLWMQEQWTFLMFYRSVATIEGIEAGGNTLVTTQ